MGQIQTNSVTGCSYKEYDKNGNYVATHTLESGFPSFLILDYSTSIDGKTIILNLELLGGSNGSSTTKHTSIGPVSVFVDETEYVYLSADDARVDMKKNVSLKTWTISFDESYSEKTISLSVKAAIYLYGINSQATGSITLPKITPSTCVVTFDPNGGMVNETTRTVTVGSTYGSVFPTPERDGYNFLGWYDSSNTRVQNTSTVPDSDHTLYAKWEIK